MKLCVALTVFLGTAGFGLGFPDEKLRNNKEVTGNNDLSFNEIDVGNSAIKGNASRPHFVTLDNTNKNLMELFKLLEEISEADCFRHGGVPRSRRGIWEDAVAKIKETYQNVANKVKESATKVKDQFHETFVNSGFQEKVKDFFERVAREFNIDNMCRNVQKLNNVLRRYPIDDKISTLMSFLDIILCQLAKDNDAGYKELTENPKFERIISEKDAEADFQRLLKYIQGLDNIEDPEVPEDLLSGCSAVPTSRTVLIMVLGSAFVLRHIV